MATEQNTPRAAAPLSTMATLQRALERVGATQDRRDNEGPLPKSAPVGSNFIRETAITELYEQANFLRQAILREPPTGQDDLFLLIAQAASMAERVASGDVCQEWRDSLCIAVENALAFMAQDRGFEADESTTLGYGVHLAQQRFEARI